MNRFRLPRPAWMALLLLTVLLGVRKGRRHYFEVTKHLEILTSIFGGP